MSGAATKENTRRVTAAEHDATRKRVTEILDSMGIPWRLPTQFSGKTSHGDIDVVISDDHVPENFLFPEGKGQVSRPGFTHFAFPVAGSDEGGLVQVDLIRTPEPCLEQTKTYLSHGTLGNLLGLVCRSIGMRYGMQGVAVIARNPAGVKCGDVKVTHDPYECLNILGLPEADIQHILHGEFTCRENHYPVLTRLPFFHRDCIHPLRMTAPNRGRDKKRPEVEPCREWMLANVPETPWELPWRDDGMEKYLQHQYDWQRVLLGAERHDQILAKCQQVVLALTQKTGAKGAKGIWFNDLSKLLKPDGVEPAETGQLVWEIVNARKTSVEEFVKNHSVEQAAAIIKTHLQEKLKENEG